MTGAEPSTDGTVDARHAVISRLAQAGFLAPDVDARALLRMAAGDRLLLDSLVERRLTGEPLAWITGTTRFCGLDLRIDPGVYVPRPQTELLARRASDRLPDAGIAVDLCTGSGAIAAVLAAARPGARVVATELDARAVACAQGNGVEALAGDLFAPLPVELAGRTDVVVACVPYVPTGALAFLQRDALTFESPRAYDGGEDGTVLLRRVVEGSTRFLRSGGTLLLELGGDEPDRLADDLRRAGFVDPETWLDDDGDVRGLEARLARPR